MTVIEIQDFRQKKKKKDFRQLKLLSTGRLNEESYQCNGGDMMDVLRVIFRPLELLNSISKEYIFLMQQP